MDKEELARLIFTNVATEVAKVNEVWHDPIDEEGVKRWRPANHGYDRDKVHSQLKNVAEFAQNAAEIFEAEVKNNG